MRNIGQLYLEACITKFFTYTVLVSRSWSYVAHEKLVIDKIVFKLVAGIHLHVKAYTPHKYKYLL